MVIRLDSELEVALIESAQKAGVDPDALAIEALRDRFLDRSA